MRYQDPALEKRGAAWVIRPVMLMRQKDGTFKRERAYLRLCPATETRSKALRLKAEVMAKVNAGTLIVQNQMKVAELLALYREKRVPELTDQTRLTYRAPLDDIEAAFGALDIGQLNRAHVQDWISAMDARIATKRLRLGVLRVLYSFAAERELWDGKIPTTGIRILGAEAREKKLLSAEEVQRLCEELEKQNSGNLRGTDARLMVLIAGVTGARIGEIAAARWEDMDLEAERWTICRTMSARKVKEQPKTAAGRRDVFLGPLVAELRDRAGEGYVFPGNGGEPIQVELLRARLLLPAAKRAGVYYEGFGFHSLRRYAITANQEAGATPFQAARAAGHTNPAMTYRYTLQEIGGAKKRAEEVGRKLLG